jgi:hypothetical protein
MLKLARLLAVVVVMVSCSQDSTRPSPEAASAEISRIDLNQQLPSVSVAAGGHIWVVDHRSSVIAKIDPTQNEVVDEIDLESELGRRVDLWDVESGVGSVWVTAPSRRRIYRLDAETGDVVGTIRTRTHSPDLYFAAGSLWFVESKTGQAKTDRPLGRSTLVRVDPSTEKVTASFLLGDVNSHVADMVEQGGSVWVVTDKSRHVGGTGLDVTFHVSSELWKINPRVNRVVGKTPLGSTLTSGAVNPVIGDAEVDGSSLWLSWVPEQILVKMNPQTGFVEQKILLEEFDYAWEFGLADGYLWIGNLNESEIAKVDPETRDREVVEVEGEMSFIGTGFGSVWVPLSGGSIQRPAGVLIRLDDFS